MKQKLISLLTLLVLCVTGAWAATVDDLVAISSDYTFTASSGLTDGTLYDSGKIISLGGNGYNDGLQIKTNRQIAFKVSGACTVTFTFTEKSGRNLQAGSASAGTQYGTSSTTPWVCSVTSAGVVYVSASKDLYLQSFSIVFPVVKTATAEALKSSAAVKMNDVALTLDDVSNGYSIDGSIITLSDDITALSTPSNIELVKTITYDDASTKDEDVEVTFDGTITSGYYIGTATLGLTGSETEYTVRVKQNKTPTAILSATSGSIAIENSYTVIGTTTVTLTGGNLTDGTYDVTADVEGTTISPASFTIADGIVNQEFTITSSASSAATTVFTFGTDAIGVTAPTYTLNYSKLAKRSLEYIEISKTTTWDWSKAYNADVQLTDNTSPSKTEEFLMSDLIEVKNDANFNAQALKIIAEYATREQSSVYFTQGNSVKFTTNVPGTVEVWFSNTGNRGDDDDAHKDLRRYLVVNGKSTNAYTLNTTMKSASVEVPAGDVVLTSVMGVDQPAATMLRISKIIFTPATVTVGVPASKEYATFNCDKNLDFTDVTDVYAYTAKISGSTVTLTKVTGTVPANEGLLIRGTSLGASADVPVAASASEVENDFVAVTADEGVNLTSGYVLATVDGVQGFYRANTSGTFVSKGKAYLPTGAGARLTMVFDDEEGGELTGISLNKREATATDRFFNLSGQRVAQPSKGLYIVNGKKVIVK